ncbi:glutamate receptor 2-like, partial [Lampetra fluviatilis]
MLQALTEAASRHNWQLTALSVEGLTDEGMRSLFDELSRKQERRLVLDTEPDKLAYVLDMVMRVGKHVKGYHYILANL